MKKFIALNALVLALFFAHGSQAADSDTVSAKIAHNSVSFMMDSVMMDGYVLYSCDALESTVTSMLKQMGATHVSVNCVGDADPMTPSFAPSIDAKFDSVRMATHGEGTLTAAYGAVKFSDTAGCFEANQILSSVAGYFDVKDMHGLESCDSDDQAYEYSFSTLFAR